MTESFGFEKHTGVLDFGKHVRVLDIRRYLRSCCYSIYLAIYNIISVRCIAVYWPIL